MAPSPRSSASAAAPVRRSPGELVYADLADRGSLDLTAPVEGWPERHARGKALRGRAPRSAHAEWSSPPDRPDPLDLLDRSNVGRLPDLLPIRMGRMYATRFGFYRGNSAIMAWDLAHTPVSGFEVLLDGDAHLSNFGLFGTVERDVVFDLNDFDESTVGPWEWDLKRLVVSVEVAGRDLGLDRRQRRAAIQDCLKGYRWEIRRLERVGALDVWYMFLFAGRKGADIPLDPSVRAVLRTESLRAADRTNEAFLNEVAEQDGRGSWRLRDDPPIQTPVSNATREAVITGLAQYALSLPRARRSLLSRYHVVDVARHVVGVGSVGTRCYLVLLFGNGPEDPLFLQVKEATVPAATPYVRALPPEFLEHQGRRVVTAQMGLNSSPDILLGWTEVDGRPFYVRQMRNLKGGIPLERLGGSTFPRYVRACGAILARAHARGGDPAVIAGYWGDGHGLEEALTRFAGAYAEQVEQDHAALVRAVERGRVEVARNV